MFKCDINCDMGEGGGNDHLIMPYLSSANISCGAHAGDDQTIKETILLSNRYNVKVGAHPSFYDKQNFGRTEINLPHLQIYHMVTDQVVHIKDISDKLGIQLHHVKPHGALYNMAAIDPSIAAMIAKAVEDVDNQLVIYGLSNSFLISEAKKCGLSTCNEVFADRSYQEDGTLTPRSQPGALINDEKVAMAQVLKMIKEKKVITTSGKEIAIVAETVCIHGDGSNAIVFAKKLNEMFKKENIQLGL